MPALDIYFFVIFALKFQLHETVIRHILVYVVPDSREFGSFCMGAERA